MNYNDAAAQAYNNPLGAAQAAKLRPPTLERGPSLEDRLQHLQRGVERLLKLRAGFEQIADRISLVPEAPGGNGQVAPAPTDLIGRFGDAINDAHSQLDALERLSERIYFGLFSSTTAQAGSAR